MSDKIYKEVLTGKLGTKKDWVKNISHFADSNSEAKSLFRLSVYKGYIVEYKSKKKKDTIKRSEYERLIEIEKGVQRLRDSVASELRHYKEHSEEELIFAYQKFFDMLEGL